MAQPSIRTPEIDNAIIDGVSEGKPLRQLCRELGIGKTTFYTWMESDEELAGRFARARLDGFDVLADQCLEIANTPITGEETELDEEGHVVKIKRRDMIDHRRLQIDTRLKLLAKWDPKRYGEKVTQELTGANGKDLVEPADPIQIARQVAFILESGARELPETE